MVDKAQAYRQAKQELAKVIERYYYFLQVKEKLEEKERRNSPDYLDCLNDLADILEKILQGVAEIQAARELSNGEKAALGHIKKRKRISVKQLAKELEKPYKEVYRTVMVLDSLRYVNTKWFAEIQELRVYPLEYEY